MLRKITKLRRELTLNNGVFHEGFFAGNFLVYLEELLSELLSIAPVVENISQCSILPYRKKKSRHKISSVKKSSLVK